MNTVVVCGGGTGGHIFPAVSIIENIKKLRPDTRIVYIGGFNSLEEDTCKNLGIEFIPVKVYSFMDGNRREKIQCILGLIKSGLKTRKILKKINPSALIATGGYSTGPAILAAKLNRVPIYLHEQNVYPGLANKIFSKFAKKVFISFASSIDKFPIDKSKLVFTGNPVREVFKKEYKFKEPQQIRTIFSFGGSGGSKPVTELVLMAKDYIKSNQDKLKWIHLTGVDYYEEYLDKFKGIDNLEVYAYLRDMEKYYEMADLIIGRSGAITLTEISALGKPSILIPSENVANDHQRANAKVFRNKGASVIIEESELLSSKSIKIIDEIINDDSRLESMSKNAYELYPGDAAQTISEIIIGETRL